MKLILLGTLLFFTHLTYTQVIKTLEDCPKTPNCVCTTDSKKRKQMKPLYFTGSIENATEQMKKLVLSIEGTTLIEERSNYLAFSFSTALGKFIDDVCFYFDTASKKIEFRSASRLGYSDLGANKRRMRKISQQWQEIID